MNDNANQNTQQTNNSTPEGTGGRTFTQEQVNEIVRERLARQKEQLTDGNEYKAKYESVLAELNGMKAAQLRQAKEDAYRALLLEASISEKRINTVMRASRAEIDALELDEAGKIVGADKLTETIKADWADFVVTYEVRGADVAKPPMCTPGHDNDIAAAFKPKM